MNANKVIHEAMGLCWHESKMELGELICDKCSVHVEYVANNPDYTDPVHYCALMDWMRGKSSNLELWINIGYAARRHSIHGLWGFMDLPRKEQINMIAAAIEAGVLR